MLKAIAASLLAIHPIHNGTQFLLTVVVTALTEAQAYFLEALVKNEKLWSDLEVKDKKLRGIPGRSSDPSSNDALRRRSLATNSEQERSALADHDMKSEESNV